jgi:hypothetical protein
MNNERMKVTLFQLAGQVYEGKIGVVGNLSALVSRLEQAWVQTVIARADIVRQVGGFDAQLRYQEDQDFLFRMALKTKFCYVNLPMVLIDRSPGEQRHSGTALDWHKEEFRLRMLQHRLEKNLALSSGLPPDIPRLFRDKLGEIYSGWANVYLESGQHTQARESILRALKHSPSLNLMFKWAMLRLAPELTTKVVSLRSRRRARRTLLKYGLSW